MEFQQTGIVAIQHQVGAQLADGGVRYRIWAPDHEHGVVWVRTQGKERRVELTREDEGFHTAFDPEGRAGDLYQYAFGDGPRLPDPASRFQPQGVHGPSECVDPQRYRWRAEDWRRPAWRGQTIYELHLGTFTADGTFRTAIDRLDHVVALGAEAIEIMPVADFDGDRNWGYDGVALYAPARCYGRPDDFRALIDAAHERGLMVILDVVYNHLGPSGNYLQQFSQSYFREDRHTPWGHALNFAGADNRPVRDFFLGNAIYWLDEFRIDGLRLDATHAIIDESPRHILSEISEAAHERGAFLIAEDERNSVEVLNDAANGGHGIDAVWSDDFHHQVRVALTGVREAYFASFPGTPDALATTLDQGWFYTGQGYPFWSGRPRGGPARDFPASSFVYCIENHDQVGNRALGERLEHLVAPELFRTASALLCLSPYVPLIFMGQEWAASSPFLFFTNHHGDLGRLVSEGRRREFAEAGLNAQIRPEQIPDPQELTTFVRSKLDWREVDQVDHPKTLALYRQCLGIRKQWLRPALARRGQWSTAVCEPAVAIRYEPNGGRVVLVLVSFWTGTLSKQSDFPALAPPAGHRWRLLLQTGAPEFGGQNELLGSALGGPEEAWLDFRRPGAVAFVAEELGCP